MTDTFPGPHFRRKHDSWSQIKHGFQLFQFIVTNLLRLSSQQQSKENLEKEHQRFWIIGHKMVMIFEHNRTMSSVRAYVPVNSKTAHHPPPRAIPGHLTRVKLRTVGNLTQNEARPVGHLTFVSKRLSAVGNKRISQFFDSARAPRSRVIALVDSTWVFLLLSFLYRGICLCLKCGAKTSWTRNS